MMHNLRSDLTKKYYKISDVAEILGIAPSTLRFWEKKFTTIKPHRSESGQRYYTPEDIERIQSIYFLVKDKGMKLEAAEEYLRTNPDIIDRTSKVVNRLRAIRSDLQTLLSTLRQMK